MANPTNHTDAVAEYRRLSEERQKPAVPPIDHRYQGEVCQYCSDPWCAGCE